MIKELFYLKKSDRKVVLSLLVVIVIAMTVIFFAGGSEETNAPLPADTLMQKPGYRRDTTHKQPHRERTIYVRTKVVYRDTAFARGKAYSAARRDSAASAYPAKIKAGEHVNLCTADTTVLKTVPGIGGYFARKIVRYGERLGGYVSVDQLDEIEGFPLDAKEYFVIESPSPRKLNLNRLSLDELKKHPYINFYQAREITTYRRLHGPLKSLSDLRLSRDFPPDVIARLQPYVEF